MKNGTAFWARAIYAVVILLALADVVLLFLSRATPIPRGAAPRAVGEAWGLLLLLIFATMGVLIVTRRPGNVIGWTFVAAGIGLAVGPTFGHQYAIYSILTNPGVLPGGQWAAWLGNSITVPALYPAFAALLLLFPDGRLLSSRWRPVAWLVVGWIAAISIGNFSAPLEGPLGVPSPIRPAGAVLQVMTAIGDHAWPVSLVVIPAAVASVVVRFRQAKGEQRQQLKWLVSAAALLATGVLATGLVPILEEVTGWIAAAPGQSLAVVAGGVALLGLTSLPVAAGLAILQYRLYEIDRIISRTVAYAVLSVLLGLSYLTAVLVLGRVLDLGKSRSSVVVAGSTLAVAALFQPLRKRVQAAVDRRFNRRRYDSDRTADAFSIRLREELDLQTLNTELLTVVNETLQPVSVSMWLRPSTGRGNNDSDVGDHRGPHGRITATAGSSQEYQFDTNPHSVHNSPRRLTTEVPDI
jgi:hypothetical protein